ncbi:MAG TPA: radical SAM protein, partial [Negativicutes bacterium]|nr:radical SAM protein [Negativicutes bacterium]
MKKKLLLIQPTPRDCKGSLVKKNKLYFVGLALPALAALTPTDWQVELCLETIEEVPFDTDAGVIGISSMGHAVIRSIEIAQEFKKRGKTVVMGGYMVSLMAEEAKKYCDAVVIGDAEEVWKDVLSDIESGKLKPFYKKELTELVTPIPRYDLLLGKKIGNFLPVQAGRGCPHSCSFCSVYCLYHNKYYRRDIGDVIRDIKHVKALGFKRFLLLDDNIYSDPAYMEELCREIGKLGMTWLSQCSIRIGRDKKLLRAAAESGCIALSFGLESTSRESLDSVSKSWADPLEYEELLGNIRAAGIDVSTEMIVGADGDTLESIAAMADFIEKNKIVVPRFYILTPIPGTVLYDNMKRENRICNDNIYSYNGTEAVHMPMKLSPEELTDAYWELYNRVFTLRSIVKRTILQSNFFRKPGMSLFYFFVNLYYKYQIKNRIPPN